MRPDQAVHHQPTNTPNNRIKCIPSRLALLLSALLFVVLWAAPALANEGDACIACHGNYDSIHLGLAGHGATSQIGSVVLFTDDAHDEAGWYGPKPYFEVAVNCSTCHTSNLLNIHANSCSTCHPTPYEQLGGPWLGGCQQGGCHVTYHDDAITAHLPFEDHFNTGGNDCLVCHDQATWAVPQTNCLNCHAGYTADTTPPETSTDAQALYEGGAVIKFSMMDNGKVGIGTTFYRLDGAPEVTGMQVSLNSPGQHTLEYWSVDQSGNVESPVNSVAFQIFSETEPPTTTSNAQSLYYQGAVIKLTPYDNSPTGVKATYYRINGGANQTGTNVVIPSTPGTINYTLDFWSEDWGYNIESVNTVNFTVISGHATLRLIWGDSDSANPNYPPQPDDSATWTVRRGSWSGPIVRTGSASYPWNGINDISVPLQPSTKKYFVRVLWNSPYWDESGQTDFPNIYPTTPGQVIKLYY